METQAVAPWARSIPLASITPSRSNPRKRFDPKAMDELTDSVKKHGVMQPVLVRPNGGENHFELVAGERRYRAAKAAGVDDIPCVVRTLTDAEALELQVVENLQREDLHPLEEAEGYEQLLKLPGHSVDDIAAKVGKSRAYVYARMKLCALCPKARDAFYAGDLSASTALLIARIPLPELQAKAAKEITGGNYRGDVMPYRDAVEFLQRNYMLRLADAPFKVADAELVPKAGSCTACPKRSGNQPELFEDVKTVDMCTDPTCFAAKKLAHAGQVKQLALERGQVVIVGKQAKELKPSQYSNDIKGYVSLDATCYDDAKHRTYRQILGKDCPPPAVLEDPHDKAHVMEIVPLKEAKPLLAQKLEKALATLRGVGAGDDTYKRQQKAQEAKAKLEKEIRRAIFMAVHERVALPLDRDSFNEIATAFYEDVWHDLRKTVDALWGWSKAKAGADVQAQFGDDLDADDDDDGDDDHAADRTRIAKLTDSELLRFLVDLSLVKELQVSSYGGDGECVRLNAAADRLGVDHTKIRSELTHDAKARAKAKAKKTAPAKKKPAAKKAKAAA